MIPFDRPVVDIIRQRRSWRTYLPEAIGEKERGRIHEMLGLTGPGPFGTSARIVLVERDGGLTTRVKGTYGVVRGARSFLVGIVRKGVTRFEDFGYLFEEIILGVTSLGLATCWMGGTFSRDSFGASAGTTAGDTVAAMSPVGFPAGERSAIDALFVKVAGSRRRKDFGELFFKDDFSTPLNERMAGPYGLALEMVRLGPSSSNRQPWRIVMAKDVFHFFLKRTPLYGSLFKEVDLQRVDMGIAMYHFERTAREQGLGGSWQEMDPGPLALPPNTEYVASFVP